MLAGYKLQLPPSTAHGTAARLYDRRKVCRFCYCSACGEEGQSELSSGGKHAQKTLYYLTSTLFLIKIFLTLRI